MQKRHTYGNKGVYARHPNEKQYLEDMLNQLNGIQYVMNQGNLRGDDLYGEFETSLKLLEIDIEKAYSSFSPLELREIKKDLSHLELLASNYLSFREKVILYREGDPMMRSDLDNVLMSLQHVIQKHL